MGLLADSVTLECLKRLYPFYLKMLAVNRGVFVFKFNENAAYIVDMFEYLMEFECPKVYVKMKNFNEERVYLTQWGASRNIGVHPLDVLHAISKIFCCDRSLS